MDFNFNTINSNPLWMPNNFNFSNFQTTPMPMNNVWNFQMPWNGYSTTTSSSSSSSDSYESWKAKKLKEQEKEAKTKAFLEERDKEIKKTKELIEYQDKTIKNIKKAKKADGTYVLDQSKLQEPVLKEDGSIDKKASKPKKKGFFGKAMEWAGSAWESVKNIGKSIIGYDENGKWSWKKCLKNVAITAAAIGATCIPVVGPVIGYGLLAGGVISGTIGVAKGISKLNKATTEEAKEKARQDICSGAFIGITSALGLRGLGRSLSSATSSTASATAGATSGAASTTTSAAASSGSTLAKVSRWAAKPFKDMTVNAVKATAKAVKEDLNNIKGGGFTGFMKAWGTKIKTSFKSADFHKKYQDKYKNMETSLNNKITELNNKIATETNASKRALLQEQKTMLEGNLNELRSISGFKSKTEFDKLSSTNSGIKNQEKLGSYTQNSSGGYDINGQTISQKRFEIFKKEMDSAQKSYIKDLKELNTYKESYMRNYSRKPDAHRKELNEYTDANIRAKYNTKDKLKAGKEALNNQLNDLKTKIADTETKIKGTTSRKKLAKLHRELQNYSSQKLQVENELNICNSIKFKSKLKSSTWRKNEYSLYIGGSNTSFKAFRQVTGSAITSPMASAPLIYSQWNREYSVPMFGSLTQCSEEDGDSLLNQAEQQKEDLENALKELENIDTAEKWASLKSQLEAQAKAQQEAQAQEQAENKAQEKDNEDSEKKEEKES